MLTGGMFGTIKIMLLAFAYFAAYKLGIMAERPKTKWFKAPAGSNPIIAGDWATWQKIYLGVIAAAVLITLMGSGMMTGMMTGGGG